MTHRTMLIQLAIIALGIVSAYQVAQYDGQVLEDESTGSTLVEKMGLCVDLMFKKRDLIPAMYFLDDRLNVRSENRVNDIEFRSSNVWLTNIVTASRCNKWNQDMVLHVQRTGSSVGWINCGFDKKVNSRIALGLDLSLMGIISLLRKLVKFAYSFIVTDVKPSYPEVRRSVCMSTGSGVKSLKYWMPLSSSKYYDLYIDSRTNVLRISTQKFSSLSQLSVSCGCLKGNMHSINGSIIELKFADYHSCLLASVSVAWGHGVIAYKQSLAGAAPRPYRAFKGIEVYNPGTPAMIIGVGQLGDESLGMLDCLQNQNDKLWPEYT